VSPTSSKNPTPVVLVGLCTHGLAIARSLGRKGIPVVALESNPRVPGRRTRYAEVVDATDVNGPALVTDLLRIRGRFQENPVLFVTNDNMVRVVADGLHDIAPHYRLTWPDPSVVRTLLDKREIESIARACGLGYPRSILVSDVADLEPHRADLRFPMAFKPTEPLSGFKAMKIESEEELIRELRRYQGRIGHFLLQEWVTGMERNIYFANFYFDDEQRPLASFVGRKVRSYPRNLGGACSAEPADRPDIAEEALRFFRSAPVHGPSIRHRTDRWAVRFLHPLLHREWGRFPVRVLPLPNGPAHAAAAGADDGTWPHVGRFRERLPSAPIVVGDPGRREGGRRIPRAAKGLRHVGVG
jgi:D-aspartate ligase